MEQYKYLIRIPNHLGDTIMALPSIKAFVESFDKKKVAILIPQWAEPIYNKLNAKIILVPSDKLHGLSAISYQSKLLRKYKIQNGILLTPSFSSALILFLGGIKVRYGYSGDSRRLFLNNCLTLPIDTIIHRSEKYKLLLEKAGEKKLDNYSPNIDLSDSQRNKTIELLEQNGINKTDKYIVIAPQAIAESRRWGTDNYSALSCRIIEKYNIKIALVGTPDQYEIAQKIKINNEKIVNLCGKTDIIDAASVLAGASLFIGNDSGLAHLASAVNIPLLILSGADNPEETSPISNKKTVMIRDDLECISCVKNICPKSNKEFMLCMTQISVNDVFDTISKNILTDK